MKKINIVAGLLAGMLSITSCSDYLDRTPDDQTTEQQVFTRFDKVESLVTDLYAHAKYANRPLLYLNHFSLSSISDECSASSHESAIPYQFWVGNYGPSQGMPSNSSYWQYWDDLYTTIRSANIILEGVKKYNTPDNPQDGREGDLQRRIGEVYFLRGYMHYLLIRAYGEAVYVDKVFNPGDDMAFEKESFHSMVDKICADADSAYARVDAWNGGQYFGRVDKGACLGLKAMVRWMAATPMWNGGTLPNDTRVYKDEYGYDPKRWELARDAAKAVLECKKTDGSLRYKLYETYDENDFRDVDGNAETNNKKVQQRLWQMMYDMNAIQDEWVWFVTKDKDTGWSGDVLPPSQGGHARQRPLQEQVDEYEYIGPDGYGYPIYCDHAVKDGYDDGNPYESVQRDPRFYRDIRYHGSWYGGAQLNTAEGNDAVSGSYLDQASHTGYYLRKFYKDGWDRGHGGHSISGPAIWRLPEFIYIYCEAVNELSGPNEEIYDLINQVRARSFMAPMPPAVKTDKELMNEYIQRERRVELFYENNRYWTSRLYLEPENYGTESNVDPSDWPYPKNQRQSHGMKPVEDPNGKIVVNGKNYRMERFTVEDGRVFTSPKSYLFPILQEELKRCPSLVQNPGW